MIGRGIYKYVYNDEIIYIGMSTTDIERRIKEHKYEIRFRHYKNAFKIYYIQLNNNAQALPFMSGFTLLIHNYFHNILL